MIDVVSAAMSKIERKTTATALPNGMCENAIGRLLKTSDEPLLGSSPALKSDGKIIKPASTAMRVFTTAVMVAVCISFSSLLRKLDNVIITPKPSESAKKTCPKTSIKSLGVILAKSTPR